jgi:glutamyl-tRNA(Gln) amidotransferase subunit E
LSKWNYRELGLRAGIEIHQELNTDSKLFCRCTPELTQEDPDFIIRRNFRPVLGEMGEFDKAMLVEYQKVLSIQYQGYDAYSCSYEIDETPPVEMDRRSLGSGIILCLMFHMSPIRELHVCRKNYLDGSVPCGFQRTTIFGLNGYIEIDNKKYGVNTLCVEEDAARKIEYDEKNKIITYRLDRLGIPLVEIVTDPDMNTPEEFEKVAFNLGLLLRSSGFVKRGLGTIRQDINVSIRSGSRVEIKGVQKLDWIQPLIDNEIERQLNLVKIKEEMKKRGLKKSNFNIKPIELTEIFKQTKFNPLKNAIKNKQKVMGIKLPKMKDLLGIKVQNEKSFGKEIAEKLKSITGLKGLIHSDEDLKKYKITDKEVSAIEKKLKMDEKDLFIFLFGPKNKVLESLDVIINRIKMALEGVPQETRRAEEDFTTEFIRELHGGKRLYPDTDMHPIIISDKMIETASPKIPEYPWEIIDRIYKKYKIDKEFIIDLILSERLSIFEKILSNYNIDPKLVCISLLETLKALSRKNIPIEKIPDDQIKAVFAALNEKKIAKEAIEEIFETMALKPTMNIDQILKELDIKSISSDAVERIIDEVIAKNQQLIKEQGMRAFKPMMGDVMKVVRGKMDGKKVSDLLRIKIKKFLEK